MMSVKQPLVLLLATVATFIYTFYTLGRFMLFLSAPRSTTTTYTWIFNLLDNRSRLDAAFSPIVLDTLFLIGFIFQHSFMNSALVKSVLQKSGLAFLERSIYNLTSSLCLHYLLRNWVSAQSIVLWQVNVADSSLLWWTFVVVHGLAWTVIYGGSIIMDLPEILGIKQVYYDIRNYAPPIAYKSRELRNLYTHVRHPSFICLSVILWVTNLMTLDRLLLSVVLTAYMYFSWSTDQNDLTYQRCQLKRKSQELKSH